MTYNMGIWSGDLDRDSMGVVRKTMYHKTAGIQCSIVVWMLLQVGAQVSRWSGVESFDTSVGYNSLGRMGGTCLG